MFNEAMTCSDWVINWLSMGLIDLSCINEKKLQNITNPIYDIEIDTWMNYSIPHRKL